MDRPSAPVAPPAATARPAPARIDALREEHARLEGRENDLLDALATTWRGTPQRAALNAELCEVQATLAVLAVRLRRVEDARRDAPYRTTLAA